MSYKDTFKKAITIYLFKCTFATMLLLIYQNALFIINPNIILFNLNIC
jgi:hypothetical protein